MGERVFSRKRVIYGVAVATVLSAAVAATTVKAQTVAVSGVEAQGWWQDEGAQMTHVHLGGAIPLYQQVRGTVDQLITYKLHHVDGEVNLVEGMFGIQDREPIVGDPSSILLQETRTYKLDTTLTKLDGWNDWRLQARLQDSQGRKRHTRLRGSWYSNNGRAVGTSKPEVLRAETWISGNEEGRGYTAVHVMPSSLPTGPVSGPWTIRVTFRSSNGTPRNAFASIDPDFHAGYAGQVILQAPNFTRDTVNITIDPAKLGLKPGTHKLCLKTSDEGVFPSGDLMAAVLMITFTVQ
jgi:hypothetical protein